MKIKLVAQNVKETGLNYCVVKGSTGKVHLQECLKIVKFMPDFDMHAQSHVTQF